MWNKGIVYIVVLVENILAALHEQTGTGTLFTQKGNISREHSINYDRQIKTESLIQ